MPRKKPPGVLILAVGGVDMGRLRVLKNNFTAGEVSSDLYGRSDLASYSNAAKKLRNVLVQPTGGITRRPGTESRYPNLLLAGDWTATGLPATIEGAVRSGFSAAEAVRDRRARAKAA